MNNVRLPTRAHIDRVRLMTTIVLNGPRGFFVYVFYFNFPLPSILVVLDPIRMMYVQVQHASAGPRLLLLRQWAPRHGTRTSIVVIWRGVVNP